MNQNQGNNTYQGNNNTYQGNNNPYQGNPNQVYYPYPQQPVSDKSRLAATLLCYFLGVLGVHRFYVGKVGTGILWLFTFGCFGIGTLIDFIMILCGSFKDSNGAVVKIWLND